MKRWMAGAAAVLAVVAGLAAPGPATASTATIGQKRPSHMVSASAVL